MNVCDILIKNAHIFTCDAQHTCIENGAIAVTSGRIAAVGTSQDIEARYSAGTVIDAAGGIVHPGLIDPHFHVVVTTSRGKFLADKFYGFNYADWKASLTDEDEYASALLSCLELVRQGYTMFVEPGTAFSTDAVAAAAEKAGIRASLCDPYIWDREELLASDPSLGSKSLFARAPANTERALRLLGGELRRNKDPDALVRGHVAIYGESTASDELIVAANALAHDNKVSFQQHLLYLPHLAKQETERLGHTPLQHLDELGALSEANTLIHMNAVSEADVAVLQRTQPTVIWCPSQTLDLGRAGLPAMILPRLAKSGIPIAMAVDAPFCWTSADVPLLAYLSARYEGITLSMEELLTMSTLTAARSIRMDHELGSLEVGKRADIVLRGEASSTSAPLLDPLHAAALLDRHGQVDTVMVSGKIVCRNGQPTNFDAEEATSKARASAHSMLARLVA